MRLCGVRHVFDAVRTLCGREGVIGVVLMAVFRILRDSE